MFWKLTNKTQIIYDQNNHAFLRRMRLRGHSLRVHSRTRHDASLSLSGLPAIQWRTVFVFRRRAQASFQAFARFTTLPCFTQSRGWEDPSRILRWLRLAGYGPAWFSLGHRRDQSCKPGWSKLVQTASGSVDIRCAPLGPHESRPAKVWKVSTAGAGSSLRETSNRKSKQHA